MIQGPNFDGVRRIATALVCFLLVLSSVATVQTTPADCCNGKICPLHHKHSMPTKQAASSTMECEHESGGLVPCSMSCGSHSDEAAPQTSLVFLLPEGTAEIESIHVEKAFLASVGFHPEHFINPLTPPPRFQGSSL
jgi:hypothetical protein